jgi:large-conductance mechanosensitive channel
MSNTLPSPDKFSGTWSPAEILGEEQDTQKHISLVGKWYHLTAIPEKPYQTSFVKREAERKSRLLSTAVFFLMLVVGLIIPATLFIANHAVLWLCVIMLAICAVSLILNRNGKTILAGVVITVMFELAFFLTIVSTRPFDIANLPLYDMLVLPELLVASLLPGSSIFFAALLNSLFIWGDLVFQPRTPLLGQYLSSPLFYAALVRPVVIQLLVAVVVYIWVRSTLRAIERADKAEMLAHLEHALAEQKNQLETGIQNILQTHTAISNGNLDARVPLTQDHALWPLANALNTLLTRFQRSIKAEQNMQKVQVILPPIVNALQEAELQQRPVPAFQHTGTPLDPLLSWLSGRTISRHSASPRLPKIEQKSPRGQTLFGFPER